MLESFREAGMSKTGQKPSGFCFSLSTWVLVKWKKPSIQAGGHFGLLDKRF
jgi:hypothetical protein